MMMDASCGKDGPVSRKAETCVRMKATDSATNGPKVMLGMTGFILTRDGASHVLRCHQKLAVRSAVGGADTDCRLLCPVWRQGAIDSVELEGRGEVVLWIVRADAGGLVAEGLRAAGGVEVAAGGAEREPGRRWEVAGAGVHRGQVRLRELLGIIRDDGGPLGCVAQHGGSAGTSNAAGQTTGAAGVAAWRTRSGGVGVCRRSGRRAARGWRPRRGGRRASCRRRPSPAAEPRPWARWR